MSICHGPQIHPTIKEKMLANTGNFIIIGDKRPENTGEKRQERFPVKRVPNQSNWSDAVCLMLITPEFENGIGLTRGMSTARLPRNS